MKADTSISAVPRKDTKLGQHRMTNQSTLEDRVTRLEQRVDRMNETLVTKQDFDNAIKLIHDRLNNLTMLVVGIGFLNIVAVVTVRLLS